MIVDRENGHVANDGPLVRLALWARSRRLAAIGPFARDVLLSLAAHETIERGAYQSAATIAAETGRTEKLVYRQLHLLTDIGIVEKLDRLPNPQRGTPWTVAYRILPCPPSEIDVYPGGISEGSRPPSQDPMTSIPDATRPPSGMPNDLHLGGRQRVFERSMKGKRTGAPPAEHLDGFDIFWAAYPKKVAKQAAFKAWDKLEPDDSLRETILGALEKQKASEQWLKERGAFIPYPASWLNGRRWEDEAGEVPTHADSRQERPQQHVKWTCRGCQHQWWLPFGEEASACPACGRERSKRSQEQEKAA